MSPTELRALILASGLSNSEFARRVGLDPRSMRRLLAGDRAVTDRVAADILEIFGGREEPNPYYPRDRWIAGEGPPPERREYVIHTAAPRFIARVVIVDEEGDPVSTEGPADILGGVVYATGEAVLCEVLWIDPQPSDPTVLRRLMDQAADQLERD